ncbi:hypothetical protein GCM10010399_74530 [Dactylosporangium fulvum]|uniref:Secreted protein n=1 Tax=Dactylosporangium fulvum TaxID=53359 RepID=A0ABY5VN28_9ACTN|nr:hypothetical protein [Dactylosporangium fulvum]UWP79127.1 hypothetical protein Dfulv_28620 [Dactylosporangium fulvum]
MRTLRDGDQVRPVVLRALFVVFMALAVFMWAVPGMFPHCVDGATTTAAHVVSADAAAEAHSPESPHCAEREPAIEVRFSSAPGAQQVRVVVGDSSLTDAQPAEGCGAGVARPVLSRAQLQTWRR